MKKLLLSTVLFCSLSSFAQNVVNNYSHVIAVKNGHIQPKEDVNATICYEDDKVLLKVNDYSVKLNQIAPIKEGKNGNDSTYRQLTLMNYDTCERLHLRVFDRKDLGTVLIFSDKDNIQFIP